MVAHLNRLKEHYGVVADTKVSKQQLKRIKNDKKAYVAKIQEVINDKVTNDPTVDKERTREVEYVGWYYERNFAQPHKLGKKKQIYQTKTTYKQVKIADPPTKQLDAIVKAYDQLIKEVQ